MAETVMKTIFQVRRGTAAQWENSTLVLRPGEPAFAYDTNVFKIGTGNKIWNELPVLADPFLLAELSDQVSDLKSQIFGDGDQGGQTLLERLESLEQQLGSTPGEEGTLLDRLAEAESDIVAIQDVISGSGDPQIIDTVKDLFDYAKEHGNEFAGLVSEVNSLEQKLNTIEENAQANKIEQIYAGETLLDILEGKKVVIDYATSEKGGIVKSSTGANKISVDDEGYMKVSSISTSSLTKPFGSVLIFDGGGAFEETFDGASLNNAIAAAAKGETISLDVDVNYNAEDDSDHLVMNADEVTLDLNNHTITASGSNGAIKVEGGKVVLNGSGTVEASLGQDAYSMAIWADNGTVVINDGYYCNATDGSERGTDLIYVSNKGNLEINGGTFIAAKPEWTLNCKDADYKAGTANIVVKGGKFYMFDPANNATEGPGTNYVAEGYQSVKEGDYYVVKSF